MSDPYVGEVRMFGGNFAPVGWAFCNGQLLSISSNTALFSLLGTNFGGNGTTTFGLPNLQGRVPIHHGQGPGLSPRVIGETGGASSVNLLATEMAAHSHSPLASSSAGDQISPANGYWAQSSVRDKQYAPGTTTPLVPMAATAMDPAGGSQPHDNMGPYLAVSFIIAIQGIFPQRP